MSSSKVEPNATRLPSMGVLKYHHYTHMRSVYTISPSILCSVNQDLQVNSGYRQTQIFVFTIKLVIASRGERPLGWGSLPVIAGGILRSETWQIKNECERISIPVGGKLILELSFVVKSFKG
jgi:hypothetical protein